MVSLTPLARVCHVFDDLHARMFVCLPTRGTTPSLGRYLGLGIISLSMRKACLDVVRDPSHSSSRGGRGSAIVGRCM